MHETHLHRVLRVHHLVHAEAQGGEPNVRRGTRHLPRGVSRGAQHVARDADQPRVFVHRGAVDVFHLPRGGGHPAAAGAAAAHEERRHPDWELRVFARRVQSAVPAELDLPVPHRAGVQAVDRVGERRRADRRVLRLFLLLLEILAQKREAAASELRRGKSVERDVPRAGGVREHTDSL